MRIRDWSSDVCSSDLLRLKDIVKPGAAQAVAAGTGTEYLLDLLAGQPVAIAPAAAIGAAAGIADAVDQEKLRQRPGNVDRIDVGPARHHLPNRKSTRLNSSH